VIHQSVHGRAPIATLQVNGRLDRSAAFDDNSLVSARGFSTRSEDFDVGRHASFTPMMHKHEQMPRAAFADRSKRGVHAPITSGATHGPAHGIAQ